MTEIWKDIEGYEGLYQISNGGIMNNSTEDYYTDKTRISNSNIGWFLNKGPAFLHKMLTEDVQEEKNPVLERGTMIHEYLLQPEEFQKDYVVWDKSRPTTAQQEKFCQELAFTTEIEPNKALENAYKASYITKRLTDQTVLEKAVQLKNELNDYIEYLRTRDVRKAISIWDVKMLNKIKENIESHKLAKELLNTNVKLSEAKEIHHEFHINWEYRGVQCKSLLDSVTFDFEHHICTIMDLKTTQKLWHFEESINTYDYCRQLMYYTEAARWYLLHEKNENPETWVFKWYIIGIDTTGTYDIRVFKFDMVQIYSRQDVIIDALDKISWHQQNNLWEHTKDYYDGDGSEKLNL